MKSSYRGWPKYSTSLRNALRNSSLFLESMYPRKGFIITVFTKIAKLSQSGKDVNFFDKLTWMSLNLALCSNLSVSYCMGKYHVGFQLKKYSLNWSDCIILKITDNVVSRFLPPPHSIKSWAFSFRSCQKREKTPS
jgi:hypothetical protein